MNAVSSDLPPGVNLAMGRKAALCHHSLMTRTCIFKETPASSPHSQVIEKHFRWSAGLGKGAEETRLTSHKQINLERDKRSPDIQWLPSKSLHAESQQSPRLRHVCMGWECGIIIVCLYHFMGILLISRCGIFCITYPILPPPSPLSPLCP